ncbi:MAG: helix-turn-helix transcriptional regulator [Parvibaculaceae bacterium]
MAENDDIEALGERLRAVRQSMGLSASKMAGMWGLERKTWERYEHGDGAPKANVLIGLARMGINEVWLLTGMGDMDAAAGPRTAEVEPAAARVAAYNVAYLLAESSPHIALDPEDFALTFQELFDQLLEEEEARDEQVVSFAVRRLLRPGGG